MTEPDSDGAVDRSPLAAVDLDRAVAGTLGGLGLAALGAGGAVWATRRWRNRSRLTSERESDVVVQDGYATAELDDELTHRLRGAEPEPVLAVAAHVVRYLHERDLDQVRIVAARSGRSSTILTLEASLSIQARLFDALDELGPHVGIGAEAVLSPDHDILLKLTGLRKLRLLGSGSSTGDAVPWLTELGVLYSRQILFVDWRALHHALVAGLQGQGADTILTSLLATLTSRQRPGDLRLWMIAPPRLLPAPLARLPHLVRPPVAPDDGDGVAATIDAIRAQLEARLAASPDVVRRAPELALVVGELADLNDHAEALHLIGTHGPSCGVRLLAATSAPEGLHSPLLPHFTTRLVLQTQDEEASMAVLGSSDAAFLGGGGRLLLRLDAREPVELYGYRVALEHLERLVRVMRDAYPPELDVRRSATPETDRASGADAAATTLPRERVEQRDDLDGIWPGDERRPAPTPMVEMEPPGIGPQIGARPEPIRTGTQYAPEPELPGANPQSASRLEPAERGTTSAPKLDGTEARPDQAPELKATGARTEEAPERERSGASQEVARVETRQPEWPGPTGESVAEQPRELEASEARAESVPELEQISASPGSVHELETTGASTAPVPDARVPSAERVPKRSLPHVPLDRPASQPPPATPPDIPSPPDSGDDERHPNVQHPPPDAQDERSPYPANPAQALDGPRAVDVAGAPRNDHCPTETEPVSAAPMHTLPALRSAPSPNGSTLAAVPPSSNGALRHGSETRAEPIHGGAYAATPALASTQTPLYVQCFGGPRVLFHGEHVWPASGAGDSKPWELLLYLSAQPAEGVMREVVTEAFWPNDERDVEVGHRLRQLRYRLRTVLQRFAPGLPGDVVLHDGGVFRLDPELVTSDAQCFLALQRQARTSSRDDAIAAYEQARALYRGDLFDAAAARRYAWAEDRDDSGVTLQEHLRKVHHQLTWNLADIYRLSGQLDQALVLYRELGERDPADESLWAALFRTQYERRDLEGLLAEEQRLRQALRALAVDDEEEDADVDLSLIEPGAETVAEFQRLVADLTARQRASGSTASTRNAAKPSTERVRRPRRTS